MNHQHRNTPEYSREFTEAVDHWNRSVDGNITISADKDINDLNALAVENVFQINGDLIISANSDTTILNLGMLKHKLIINGNFIIENNAHLEKITIHGKSFTLNGGITISGNTKLTTLPTFSIYGVVTTIVISNNPKLIKSPKFTFKSKDGTQSYLTSLDINNNEILTNISTIKIPTPSTTQGITINITDNPLLKFISQIASNSDVVSCTIGDNPLLKSIARINYKIGGIFSITGNAVLAKTPAMSFTGIVDLEISSNNALTTISRIKSHELHSLVIADNGPSTPTKGTIGTTLKSITITEQSLVFATMAGKSATSKLLVPTKTRTALENAKVANANIDYNPTNTTTTDAKQALG
jgi:hypothetical protein